MSEASFQPLSIDISFPVEGTVLVELVGELDVVSVDDFSVRVDDLAGGGRSHVVIDLSGITFIDSSGINSLIRAVRSIEEWGGTAVLAAPSTVAQRVFAITKLAQRVAVEHDRQTAIGLGSASSSGSTSGPGLGD